MHVSEGRLVCWRPTDSPIACRLHGGWLLLLSLLLWPERDVMGQVLVDLTVTPHRPSPVLRWRRPSEVEPAARVELFVVNDTEEPLSLGRDTPVAFDGVRAEQLRADGLCAWHDTPEAWLEEQVVLPPAGLAVLAFNGRSAAWAVGTEHTLSVADQPPQEFSIEEPACWLEKVVFVNLADEPAARDTGAALQPERIVIHLRNASGQAMRPVRAELWLPARRGLHQAFLPARSINLEAAHHETAAGIARVQRMPAGGVIAAGEAGIVVIDGKPLPLGYAVLEVVLADEEGGRQSVGARVRIRPEAFDISGGWVASRLAEGNSLTSLPYLKTLRRMHINTGQIEEVAGYTDNPDLYAAYPLKRFNRLGDTARYDTDEMLPTIHAVEFIGEPQYGGGRPVPPQEVWERLAPYQPTRLPTSVTFSEERNWCHYAGLSDFAHFDAYRVTAPAADNWRGYDRWSGESIRWGAPLETIGDMTRSLAHHWRPAPIAIWSQGAHDGWGGPWNPRRASPTPDELRSQAWHGLGNGVHSLYWFNLSLKSIVAFPDLIEPITRVNREATMLAELLLAASLSSHERIGEPGDPSWDLTVLGSPQAAVLAAHDLAYTIDSEQNVFRFTPRDAELAFAVPDWLGDAPQIFRVDADGTHDVTADVRDGTVRIRDTILVVGVYVATQDATLRDTLDARHRSLLSIEAATGFDPASSPDDLAVLAAVAEAAE